MDLCVVDECTYDVLRSLFSVKKQKMSQHKSSKYIIFIWGEEGSLFYIAFEGRYGGTTPELDGRWCISQASNNKSVLNNTPGLKGNVETNSIMWQAMWVGEKNKSCTVLGYPNGQGDAISPVVSSKKKVFIFHIHVINYLWPSLFGQGIWI